MENEKNFLSNKNSPEQIPFKEIKEYLALVKKVESLVWPQGLSSLKGEGKLLVSFSIKTKDGSPDWKNIRVTRNYSKQEDDRILVSDLVDDFPSCTVQPRAFNYFLEKDADDNVVAKPYEDSRITEGSLGLMIRAGKMATEEGSEIFAKDFSPGNTGTKTFVLSDGEWRPVFK